MDRDRAPVGVGDRVVEVRTRVPVVDAEADVAPVVAGVAAVVVAGGAAVAVVVVAGVAAVAAAVVAGATAAEPRAPRPCV